MFDIGRPCFDEIYLLCRIRQVFLMLKIDYRHFISLKRSDCMKRRQNRWYDVHFFNKLNERREESVLEKIYPREYLISRSISLFTHLQDGNLFQMI